MLRPARKPKPLEDRGAYLPTKAQIAASAAKIREDWSPKTFANRSGLDPGEVSTPEFHSPDLAGAIQEALRESVY